MMAYMWRLHSLSAFFAHDLIIGDRQHAGLRNLLKSQLDPVQLGVWLGFISDPH